MTIPTTYVWVHIIRTPVKRCGEVPQVREVIDWESAADSIEAVKEYADTWHEGEGYVAEVVGELRSVWQRLVEAEEVDVDPQAQLFT